MYIEPYRRLLSLQKGNRVVEIISSPTLRMATVLANQATFLINQ